MADLSVNDGVFRQMISIFADEQHNKTSYDFAPPSGNSLDVLFSLFRLHPEVRTTNLLESERKRQNT